MEKKPAIRFERYNEDWEQRKLGELFQEYSEKNHEELPALMIVQGEGTIRREESERRIIYDKTNLSNYKLVNKGDFIVHLRSFEGGLEKATDTGIISPAYHTFHGNEVDSGFYYLYFRSPQFIDIDLRPHVYGIRDGRSIDVNGMKTIRIPYTSGEEQAVIANYFEQLGALISLHQSNYEKMIATKKSMLDKLFPQGDSKVPAIRFGGFVEDWEKKPLSSIVIPYSDPVEVPHDGYERLGIRSHGKGVFHEYVEAGKEITTAQLHRVAAHNFIVNITFAWEHAVAVTCDSDAGKLVSHRFPQFSMADGIHDQFLKYLILDARFRHHLLLSSPGGAGRNRVLKIPEMLEYEMMIPDIEEQKQIAGYLNSLDELIDLYRIRIEKLKNIKAACLQGMFV